MKFPVHTRRRRLAKQLPLGLAVGAASPLLKTVAWVSAGVGAVALGLVVGREIRQRYKFKRRTPYDRYARSGASFGDDFGLGV